MMFDECYGHSAVIERLDRVEEDTKELKASMNKMLYILVTIVVEIPLLGGLLW